MDQSQLLSMIAKIRQELDCLEKAVMPAPELATVPAIEPTAVPSDVTPAPDSAAPSSYEIPPVTLGAPPPEATPATGPTPAAEPVPQETVSVIDSPKARIELQQEEIEKQKRLERIQRAAGTFYLSKKVSVLDTFGQ